MVEKTSALDARLTAAPSQGNMAPRPGVGALLLSERVQGISPLVVDSLNPRRIVALAVAASVEVAGTWARQQGSSSCTDLTKLRFLSWANPCMPSPP